MPNDPKPIQIDLTPRFQKDLHTLAKRYYLGDQVSGMKLTIFKVRLKNSDIQKGKVQGIGLSTT